MRRIVVASLFLLLISLPARGALVSTGADGALDPGADFLLPFRADGIFNFSTITIGSGITLGFDPAQTSAMLLSIGDILIEGALDAHTLSGFTLSTPATLTLTGSLIAGSGPLTLEGGAGGVVVLTDRPGVIVAPTDIVTLGPLASGGTLTLRGGSGSVTVVSASPVPLPAPLLLLSLAMVALGPFLRRKTACR